MPFNTTWNPKLPPFAPGYMTLNHDEVVYVKTNCERIVKEYKPANYWDAPTPSDDYVINAYNNIDGWKKAINGENYNLIKQYDPEINLLGTDATGIIKPIETPIDPEVAPTVEESPTVETGEEVTPSEVE